MENNLPVSITCICGNAAPDKGIVQCDQNAVAFGVHAGYLPARLAKIPDDESLLYVLCPSYGHIYPNKTITGRATVPVFKTAEVKSGLVDAALKVLWEISG